MDKTACDKLIEFMTIHIHREYWAEYLNLLHELETETTRKAMLEATEAIEWEANK